MPEPLTTTLHTHFGFPAFRPGQAEAIDSLLAGEHTLVVMPTGAGKSLIYQVAALRLPGLTLVLSPLIALMQDQVDGLARRNIPATAIHSALPAGEQARRLRALAAGAFRLAYVAPERLRSVPFQEVLQQITVSLLAVDEAHCVSEWGHDFRPDYLHIAAARAPMGDPVTVALTATATPQVQDDIVRLLDLPAARRIITGFNRPNLTFEVRYTTDLPAKLEALQVLLAGLATRRFEAAGGDGAAIVYVGTRRDAEEVAEFLRVVGGVEARHYHAGLESERRARTQEAFLAGELPVVVATNAFGMGIDRPDVRLVVHYALPSTLEAYYQEAGRAGRDGQPARAVLLYAPQDRALHEWFIENMAPAPEEVRALYEALAAFRRAEGWITRDNLSLVTGVPDVKAKVGLAQLERAGAVQRLGDEGPRMLLRRGPWDAAAVRATAQTVEALRRQRRAQLARMITYAEANTCRRRILLDHFGDHSSANAPRCCDNCTARSAHATVSPPNDVASLSQAERTALIILDALRRLKWEIGRQKLAQLLKGSRAKAMQQVGYDRQPYYGKLAVFTLAEIEGLIEQLITQGYLKVIGGEHPVLRLTPQSETALSARASIPLRLPRVVPPEAVARKQAEREAGGTVALTAELLAEGMTPAEIAARRGLSEHTIYGHLARLIGEGAVPLPAVVPEEIAAQVRAAIAQVGDVTALTHIKACLPDRVSYEEIFCVLAALRLEQGERESCHGAQESSHERIQRVVQLGETRSESGVPVLIASLDDPDGNVRRLAASALGKIGDPRAVAPLIALLAGETRPQVRQYAVKALGMIGDPRARALLQHIAGDSAEREYTQAAARAALRRLSDQSVEENAITAFLARSRPRPLSGPWHTGWALDFHSRFSGANWSRSRVGDLVYRLKYQADGSAFQPLVEQLLAVCAEHAELAAVDALVPVPRSAPQGPDLVGALAEALGGRLGHPVWSVLVKTRRTSPQKEMRTLAQKRANVAGAFAVRGAVGGKRLLVLDDLYDSGATLEEVSRVLQQAGAEGLCVLTLTRTIHADV